MGEESAVEICNVVKRFNLSVAVDHVNLQIQDGEFFPLLGPSGCGKTTTLRLILGFETPTNGALPAQVILTGKWRSPPVGLYSSNQILNHPPSDEPQCWTM